MTERWSKEDYTMLDQATNEMQRDGLASVPGLANGEEAQRVARYIEDSLGIEKVNVKRISHQLGLYEFTAEAKMFRKDKLRKKNGKYLARDFAATYGSIDKKIEEQPSVCADITLPCSCL